MPAPLVDATSSTFNLAFPGSLTWSHTVGAGSNRLLIVAVSINKTGIIVSTITYGGVSLSKIANITCQTNNIPNQSDTELWSLLAPASGTANIVVTCNASSTEAFAAGISFSNVSQGTPIGTPATIATSATPQSVTVSSTTSNQIVVDSIASNNGSLAVGAGQTSILHQVGNHIFSGASYKPGGSPSTTMSWTVSKNDTYGQVAVAVNGASIARTVPTSAALLTTQKRTITATTAIKQTTTRTIGASVALLTTNQRSIPDTTALLVTSNRTMPLTAALLQTSKRTISITAALLATQKRTISDTAALLIRQARTLNAQTALLVTSTRTIEASAALAGERAISCSAALTATFEPNALLILPSGQTTLLVPSGQTSLIVPSGETILIIE